MNTYSGPSALRVGDSERDAAVEQLTRHFAAGRLTPLEREERTALALSARTAGDLDALLADLPPLDPSGEGRAKALTVMRPARVLPALVFAAVAVFLALHLIPLVAVAAAFAFVSRIALARQGRWRHSHSYRARW